MSGSPHFQSRIDDLTHQNRTLTHTIQKLKNELLNEEGRHNEILQELKSRWEVEKGSWTEMQHCFRIHQLKLVSQTEGLRVVIEKERNGTRRERVVKGVKEAEMLLARRTEAALKWRISGLEEELENAKAHLEEDRASAANHYQDIIGELEGKCQASEREISERTRELEEIQQEREDFESQLNSLKTQHGVLVSSSATATTKVERLTLQLEGAKTSNEDLKRDLKDLERNHASLKRQLEKWQNLDSKGEAQSNEERKRRVELEIEVKELQRRLEQKDGLELELQKEKRKAEKARATAADWQAEVKRAHEEVEAAEEIKKEMAKLRQQLENRKTRSRDEHATGKKRAPRHLDPKSDVESEPERELSQELHEERSNERPESGLRKLPTRGKGVKETDEELPKEKSRPKSKPPSKSASNVDKGGAKRRGKGTKARQESDESDEGDKEQDWMMETRPTEGSVKSKGKEKEEEEEIVQKSRKGKDTASEETKPKRSRSQSRVETQDEDIEHLGDSQQAVAKKRKMIPFPTSQPTNLEWSQFSLGDGGLNIPTALSPIKDGQTQAQELSTTSSLLSRVGSVFGVRRR